MASNMIIIMMLLKYHGYKQRNNPQWNFLSKFKKQLGSFNL